MSASFSELGITPQLVKALAARKIHAPFNVQALVLPDALAGLDILAGSPTGSGKTLAFGLPLIERTAGSPAGVSALILVPTRELASQVVDELSPYAAIHRLRVVAVYGGKSISAQIQKVKGANILVATPGRLFDLLERRAVSLRGVRVLVLDEADRMLDMGFRPQVDRILKEVPTNRQTMLFSATLDGVVADLARAYTTNPSHITATAPTEKLSGVIAHSFLPVTAADKLERLVEELKRDRGLALVFVRTKHGADKLARKLDRQHDVRAAAMHGDMSQGARERALAQFESGRISTLVATDVAARGLDVDDVTHVINFDPPAGPEDYVHRIGRTGRAGRSGIGLTFVLPEQQHDVGAIAAHLGHHEAFDGSGMRRAQPKRPGQQGQGGGKRPSQQQRRNRSR
ncbi:MAG: DEAD/DEAH box helicase [Actinomycetes bacterium]